MVRTFAVPARMSPSLVGSLKAFVLAACLLLVGAVGWYEWTSHEATLRKAEDDARLLAGSLAQHAEDTFEMVDLVLTTLANRIAISPRTLEDIWRIDDDLGTQLRQAPRIRSVMAYDKNGRQFISSQPQVPDWFDITQTQDFASHRLTYGTEVSIGKPVRSPSNNEWIIPISRRFNEADGSFGGVLVATIWVDYFANFYSAFNVNGEAGISLLANEGTLLSRHPLTDDKIGKDYSTQAWFPTILAQPEGSLRFTSPVDQVSRIHGFHRAGQFPLTLFVGVSRTSILGGWLHGCLVNMAAAGSLAICFGFFGLKLVKQVEVRQTSERELSTLARTDGLTGLKNRRAFDEAMIGEWTASASNGKPLSLLMLDVDHFKAFNDTYGHPAGDACLRLLADAIGKAVYRPRDHVARYGGEEFAVLLPDTNERSALLVADRIRLAVLGLALAHGTSPSGSVVSVSIGCSTQITTLGSDAAALLNDADRALYKAKIMGRNRVETSSLSLVRTA